MLAPDQSKTFVRSAHSPARQPSAPRSAASAPQPSPAPPPSLRTQTLANAHLLWVHGNCAGGGQLLQPLGVLADAPLLLPGRHLLLLGRQVGSGARQRGHLMLMLNRGMGGQGQGNAGTGTAATSASASAPSPGGWRCRVPVLLRCMTAPARASRGRAAGCVAAQASPPAPAGGRAGSAEGKKGPQ